MSKIYYLVLVFLLIQGITYSQTWIEQTQPATGISLNSISAYDDNNVWVCGNGGTVLRTTNGGTNWSSVGAAPIPTTLDLYNIFGTDANTALVTGSSASATFVFRTSNGGGTWTQVFTQNTGFIDAIWMGNAAAGFMVGDPVGGRWSLWGTITGGVTWDSTQFYLPQAGSEGGYNNSFFFDNTSQTVWFGSNNTRIYRSTNLIIWNTEATTTQANSFSLWFNSATNGMTGGAGTLLTTNGGTAWNPTGTALPGTGNITGITGYGANWWVVRLASIIYYTSNDGATWTTNYTAPSGNYDHIGKSRNGTGTLYAVRSNGGISKGTGLPVGVVPVSNTVPKQFSLNQNYPNPFNPSTTIKFDIPSSGVSGAVDVRLTVYDELGREIAVIVNERLNPGSYESNFDASSLSSGVYFYKLTAGSFVAAKKMNLIK